MQLNCGVDATQRSFSRLLVGLSRAPRPSSFDDLTPGTHSAVSAGPAAAGPFGSQTRALCRNKTVRNYLGTTRHGRLGGVLIESEQRCGGRPKITAPFAAVVRMQRFGSGEGPGDDGFTAAKYSVTSLLQHRLPD